MKMMMFVAAVLTAACTSAPDATWLPEDRSPGYDACEIDTTRVGQPSSIEWRTFEAGNLTRSVLGSRTPANAIAVQQEHTLTYRRDHVASMTTKDASGTAMFVEKYSYDDSTGDLLRIEDHAIVDGKEAAKSYRTETYTYSRDHQLERADFDLDADGIVDAFDVFTHDDSGCTIADDIYAGSVHDHIRYQVNAACKATRTDHDDGADGVVDRVETQTYLDGDVLPDRWEDSSGAYVKWSYDDQARLQERHGSSETSTTEWSSTYLYACQPPRP